MFFSFRRNVAVSTPSTILPAIDDCATYKGMKPAGGHITPICSYALLKKGIKNVPEVSLRTPDSGDKVELSAPVAREAMIDDSTPSGEQRDDMNPLIRAKKWQYPRAAMDRCILARCSGVRGVSFVLCYYKNCGQLYEQL